MKKVLLFLVALTLTFALAACGGGTGDTTDPQVPTITGVVNNKIEVKVGSASIDLAAMGITAIDQNQKAVTIKVLGDYNLNVVDDYTVTLRATDENGLQIELEVTLSVVNETCDENPDQDICKEEYEKALEAARIEHADLYNVDTDNDDIPNWQQDQITINIGYSYYGAEDETNSVWMNILNFMEEYPNITVYRDPLYSSGWENGDDGLLLIQEAALADGSLPDVFFNPKGAETYDKDMTLDLTPYFETDEESHWVQQNALSGMRTADGQEIWGIPWQGVGPIVAVNTGLLEDLQIDIPGYDWTYADYEALRDEVAVLNDANYCVFPGVIDFSIFGPNYFDSVPNGYKGYNIQSREFEFASATNYGTWLESVADEAKKGLHFYDLDEAGLAALNCQDISNSWLDGVRAVDTIFLWSFNESITAMTSNGYDIDIYPYPVAPEGGNTAVYTYHDYYSISKELEDDKVKAEAAYQLVKWLTYGEDGTKARWDLIDEQNELVDGVSPFMNGDLYLMDYVQGWPITLNPEVISNHPFVKGFSETSGGLNAFNFNAFKQAAFQEQLSNANPYPRQIPAFASVANPFDPWTIKDRMRDEGLSFANIAPEVQETMNESLDEYLRQYNNNNN